MKKGFGIRTPFSFCKAEIPDTFNIMLECRGGPVMLLVSSVACMLGVESLRKRRYLAWDKAKQRLVNA